MDLNIHIQYEINFLQYKDQKFLPVKEKEPTPKKIKILLSANDTNTKINNLFIHKSKKETKPPLNHKKTPKRWFLFNTYNLGFMDLMQPCSIFCKNKKKIIFFYIILLFLNCTEKYVTCRENI